MIDFTHNENSENLINSENSKNTEKPTVKKRGRPKKNNNLKKDIVQIKDGPITRSKQKKEQINNDVNVRRVEDISFLQYKNISENTNFREDDLIFASLSTLQKDPVSYGEAINSSYKNYWIEAIKEELNSMKENNVWKLVERPKVSPNGRKPNIIDSKWVFKRKIEADGNIKFKARLVIRGFKDKNEYDLKETYAPVSRLPLIRASLAVINKYDLFVSQMDVKTAFLNGELDEEVFMEIPDGLEVSNEVKQTKVCKLEKSMYGLKVSPKKWNKKFSEEARKLGLENDLHDPCLFTWRLNGKMAFVVLYVDDMIIASNDSEKLKNIKNHLSNVFQMKDLGQPNHFLGMTIQRNIAQKEMIIHQTEYTEKILEKFDMKDCKPQSTPMVTRQVSNRNKKIKLSNEENSENLSNTDFKKVPYREAIGSLMYLANATRSDIAFAINFLARKQVSPTEEDWIEVKRVFRYLRGTINHGLKFMSHSENLEAMTDASFRDCQDSTSTGGYMIRLFGDTIAWRSHKQSYVTLSTCQAEYLAMSDACQELISLDKSIRFITGKTYLPVTIWCDNQSARDCTKMDGSHKLKTFDETLDNIKKSLQFRENSGTRKQMPDTHGDFVKQCVDEGKVKVEWINTAENIADIMTKPLPLQAHNYLFNKISNLNSEQ